MDEYTLERISTDNGIWIDLLLPFTITRLEQAGNTNQEAVLSVQLRNVGDMSESQKELLLSWSSSGVVEDNIPLQERVITEWAAIGIACVLVPLYAGLRILQVTQVGDGFDYWVGDDDCEYALEVSGTVEDSLEGRHAVKVRQLQSNPYGVDGYVAVTRFASLQTIFSFHQGAEVTT
jgi:hypothetical protein